MPILRASLQHSSTRMLPNPFPRHGLAMARERTSARFSQITASAAQPMNSPPPVSRMRKSLIWPYRFDSERGNSRPSAEHSMSKPWIFFASHIRAGRKTGCMIQRSCPKNDSTKKSGLHPGTSCGAWPLPRASPVAVPTSRPLCRFTLALSPPKPLRTRTSPLFRLKLSVMIYLFLSPATTVGGVNPPFSCGMGQRHALGQLRVAGAAMCFTAGRIDSVTPRL